MIGNRNSVSERVFVGEDRVGLSEDRIFSGSVEWDRDDVLSASVVNLVTRRTPARLYATADRGLEAAQQIRVAADLDLGRAGVVRLVEEPAYVRRKLRASLVRFGGDEGVQLERAAHRDEKDVTTGLRLNEVVMNESGPDRRDMRKAINSAGDRADDSGRDDGHRLVAQGQIAFQ